MSYEFYGFTWFLALVCLTLKPKLFDHLPPLTAVFYVNNLRKQWKWPFLRHFTAKTNTEWRQLHTIFGMNMYQSQINTVWPFATYHSCFLTPTIWKKTGILRQKLTMNDNSFTWFLALVCLTLKPILFDHLPPLTAVFWHQQFEKTENGHFYGILRQKNDTKGQQLHMLFGMSMC